MQGCFGVIHRSRHETARCAVLRTKENECHDHDQRRNADLLQGWVRKRQPILFTTLPLSSDDWTPNALLRRQVPLRAHDRRGHVDQPVSDVTHDHYAADAAACRASHLRTPSMSATHRWRRGDALCRPARPAAGPRCQLADRALRRSCETPHPGGCRSSFRRLPEAARRNRSEFYSRSRSALSTATTTRPRAVASRDPDWCGRHDGRCKAGYMASRRFEPTYGT